MTSQTKMKEAMMKREQIETAGHELHNTKLTSVTEVLNVI